MVTTGLKECFKALYNIKNIFFLLLFSLSLSSCDPLIFKVVIDDNGFEKSFNFECGKVNVLCGVLGHQVHIFLDFELDFPILINPENFKIIHKNSNVKSDIHFKGTILKEETIINAGSQKMGIVIGNYRAQVGDTLIINVDNFIICKEKPLKIGDISLIFVHRK